MLSKTYKKQTPELPAPPCFALHYHQSHSSSHLPTEKDTSDHNLPAAGTEPPVELLPAHHPSCPVSHYQHAYSSSHLPTDLQTKVCTQLTDGRHRTASSTTPTQPALPQATSIPTHSQANKPSQLQLTTAGPGATNSTSSTLSRSTHPCAAAPHTYPHCTN